MQGPASWSQANPLGQGWLCWLKTSLQQRRGPVCAAHTAQPPHTASAEARRSPGNPTVIFSPAQNKSFMLVLQDSDTVWKTFSALACFFAALLDLDLFVFSTHIRAPVWVLLGSAPVLHSFQYPAPPVSLSAARRNRSLTSHFWDSTGKPAHGSVSCPRAKNPQLHPLKDFFLPVPSF